MMGGSGHELALLKMQSGMKYQVGYKLLGKASLLSSTNISLPDFIQDIFVLKSRENICIFRKWRRRSVSGVHTMVFLH